VPATEQLNIRVTPAVKERFRERAAREGMSQAQLLEALLKQRGTLERTELEATLPPKPPEPERPSPKDGPPVEPALNFTTWLQGKTGIPRALVAQAVRRGRVLVAGVPYTSELISPETLAHGVVYEGEALR
jgi:hypothetical protein